MRHFALIIVLALGALQLANVFVSESATAYEGRRPFSWYYPYSYQYYYPRPHYEPNYYQGQCYWIYVDGNYRYYCQ